MDRREPLHAELPEPETTHVMAPIPLYPSEMTCRECNALMLPFTWEDNSEWRCFPCNRRVLVELPAEADV
jgi:hypothetical protein